MENNDTKYRLPQFRVGDQKWEIVKITIGIFFFFFLLDICIHYFYIGSFQVPPKKNHPHLKCQFPLKIPIWPKSLLHEHSEKWLSPPSPRVGGRGYSGALETNVEFHGSLSFYQFLISSSLYCLERNCFNFKLFFSPILNISGSIIRKNILCMFRLPQCWWYWCKKDQKTFP